MTDKQLDINLKNALQPSYFPDNDVNRSLMDKIRSIEEVTDKDDDSRRSEERASRIRDARRPISWLVKAAIFFLVFSAVGTGGVLAANYLLKKSEVSEHGVTVGGTVNDDDLAEPWEDVPNEKLGTEEGSEGDLWYSKEVVLTNGVYQNSYYYYETYEDGIKDSGFPNIFSEPIGTPQSICYVVTEDSSTGQAVEGDAFEKTLDSIFDCNGHKVYLCQDYMPGASDDSTYSVCMNKTANTRDYTSSQGIVFTLVDDIEADVDNWTRKGTRTYVMLSYDKYTGFMYFEEMNDDDIHDILDKIVLSAQ